MKRIAFYLFLIACAGMGMISCKSDAASAAAGAKEKQDEALKAMEKSFEALKSGSGGEVADFRELQKALPEKVLGLERVDYSGQKSGIAGMQFSMAEATYSDENRKVLVKIIDTGGFGGLMSTMAAWSMVEMDKETQDGYERTTLIDGKKAFERYSRQTKEGEITVISADRFLVTVNASNVDDKDLRKVISSIKVKG